MLKNYLAILANWKRHALNAWIFLPAIPYFAVVFQNAPNIPIMDDYDAILAFLTDWAQSNWTDRLALLFRQHNEHRILHSRIVEILYYSMLGNINFRSLIFIADFQLMVIAIISAYFIRQAAGKYWKVIACIWTLCVFVYFIRMTGAPFSFDNSLFFGTLVLATLIGLLVLKPRKELWPVLCIFGFVIASMRTAALFRAFVKNAQFHTSRYLIYPQLLAAIVFLFIWRKVEGKSYGWPVIAFITAGMFKMYTGNFAIGKRGFRKMAVRAEIYTYWYPDFKRAKEISDEACKAGIYCIELEK